MPEPRKVLQTGLDALTTSERAWDSAADGMTNKEIAQTLFVTIKTVEVHLSHAYRKLEISSRAQLQNALLTRHRTRHPPPPNRSPELSGPRENIRGEVGVTPDAHQRLPAQSRAWREESADAK